MDHDIFIIPLMLVLAVLATWPMFHHRYVMHQGYFDAIEKQMRADIEQTRIALAEKK